MEKRTLKLTGTDGSFSIMANPMVDIKGWTKLEGLYELEKMKFDGTGNTANDNKTIELKIPYSEVSIKQIIEYCKYHATVGKYKDFNEKNGICKHDRRFLDNLSQENLRELELIACAEGIHELTELLAFKEFTIAKSRKLI